MKYIGVPIRNHAGLATLGATINVTIHSSGLAATLTDDDGNPIANPLTTDGEGRYEFNTTDGIYDLTIYTSAETYVLESVVISDGLTASLEALAALTPAADRVPYFTGATTAALATFTSFGRSLVACANAAAAISALGLGTMATQNASAVAISGGTIDGTNIGATTPGTVKATSVTDTGLTSGRIPLVSTGGLLADNASLTYSFASAYRIAWSASVPAQSVAIDITNTSASGAAYCAGNNDAGKYAELAVFGSSYSGSLIGGITYANKAFVGGNTSLVLFTTSGSVYIAPSEVTAATFTSTSIAFAVPLSVTGSVTASSLTAGRLTFAGTAGLLTDAATLTYVAPVLIVGDGLGTPSIRLDGAAATDRALKFHTASVERWRVAANNTAESGSNLGSNFYIAAFDDTSVLIDIPFFINRALTGTIAISRITSFSTSTATNMFLSISAPAGQSRYVQFSTAGSIRWQMLCNNGAESGANAGSNFIVAAYDDSGVFIDSPITIARVAGGVMTLTRQTTTSFTDTGTTTAPGLYILQHFTSGVPGVGFGSAITFNGHDDGNTNRNQGSISCTWTVAATATRTSKYTVNVIDSGTSRAVHSITPVIANNVSFDTATTTSTVVHSWQHQTTGTAGIGFGSVLQIQLVDDGATARTAMQLNTQWTDPASATRSSKLIIAIFQNAAIFNALTLAPSTATFITSDAVTVTAPAVMVLQHTTSGTVGNGFGSAIQINGPDDGGTQRTMAQITVTWTTAATATRASKIVFAVQTAAVSTNCFTMASASITAAAGFPVTIADTTASTTTLGALIVGNGTAATTVTFGAGNGNMGGTLTVAGTIASTSGNVTVSGASMTTGRLNSSGTATTAVATGNCSMWRSGGTIGTAGDMIFQVDLAPAAAAFVFRAGQTTPVTVFTLGAAGVMTYYDGATEVHGTSTGTKFGTATNQKMGFWNATPVIQPAGATQAAPAAYATGAFGLDSNANMQALYDLVVAMRTALVNTGIIKGAA